MSKTDAPLWTADSLAAATGGRWIVPPRPDWAPSGVNYQRKWFRPGDLLLPTGDPLAATQPRDLALLSLAASGRACGVVVQRPVKGLPRDFPVLQVKNVYRARQDLAEVRRAEFGGRVVGVTGTVGKTSVREMLRHVMAGDGEATANNANYNCIEGCANALARIPVGGAGVALEMAICFRNSSVAAMSKMARPHAAILTAIGEAHLDFYGTTAAIADHKAGIFDGLVKDGTAVICRDIIEYDVVLARAESSPAQGVLTYGEHPESDLRLLGGDFSGASSTIRANIQGREIEYELGVGGRHMALNSLGVIAALMSTGLEVDTITERLGSFEPIRGRMVVSTERVPGGSVELIDDSYNSTPLSVVSSLSVLRETKTGAEGRRFAVLGDIAHLAEHAPRLHRELASVVRDAGVEELVTVGRHMKHLHDAVTGEVNTHHFDHAESAAQWLLENIRAGDVVAIKGSIPARLEIVSRAVREGQAPQLSPARARPRHVRAQATQKFGCVVLDIDSGSLLHSYQPNQLQALRQFTKLLLVFEVLVEAAKRGGNLEVLVRVPPQAKGVPQPWGLSIEGTVPLSDLIRAVTVARSNDAAVALATWLAGSIPKAIKRLNARARSLGMGKTSCVNITGVVEKGHLTTAADIATLARAFAQRHPEGLDLLSTRDLTLAGKTRRTRNTLLFHEPRARGLAVAAVGKANHSGATLVFGESRTLAVVAFRCSSEQARNEVMLDLIERGLGRGFG